MLWWLEKFHERTYQGSKNEHVYTEYIYKALEQKSNSTAVCPTLSHQSQSTYVKKHQSQSAYVKKHQSQSAYVKKHQSQPNSTGVFDTQN